MSKKHGDHDKKHAQQIGQRIKQLGGTLPGSLALEFDQESLQPAEKSTDLVSVIKAVIDAEEGAIAQYKKIIKAVEGEDYVTQDLCIRLLADEEEHLVVPVLNALKDGSAFVPGITEARKS